MKQKAMFKNKWHKNTWEQKFLLLRAGVERTIKVLQVSFMFIDQLKTRHLLDYLRPTPCQSCRIWHRYFSDTCTKTIHVIFPVRTFIPSAHVPVPDDIDPKYGKITPACINFCFFFYTFNSHEWPRQNFSLQYQYNIKQTSDENIEKFQLTDY